MADKLTDTQRGFLWQAAQPIGKSASVVHPVAVSLERAGLVFNAGFTSRARFRALWLATEGGREHPAAQERAA